MRHAIAAERGDEWPDDTKRPLTERGISRFKEGVGGLKALDAVIDEIFTSPLVRARQTADLLAAGIDGKPTVKLLDALAPGHTPATVMAQLAKAAKRRAHRARRPRAGSRRAGRAPDRRRRPLPFKKGGICRIDVGSLTRKRAGSLVWFVTPKVLRRLRIVTASRIQRRRRIVITRSTIEISDRIVAVIINPISGTGGRPEVARQRAELAAAFCIGARRRRRGVRHRARRTRARAGARGARPRRHRSCIAWGGDGTVNEVASALAFRDVALAIIPSGSGNGLARELGIPFDPHAAFAVAFDGRERVIDAGELDGRLFFNIAGLGLDARVAHEFAATGLVRRGFARYLEIAGARALRVRRPTTTRSSPTAVAARRARCSSRSPTAGSTATAR